LYGEVFIPTAVQQEIEQGIGLLRHASDFFEMHDWIRVRHVSNTNRVRDLLTLLGRGEAECIVLAIELQADLLIIDERRGSRLAREHGLRCTGILGVLLDAKSQGVLDKVKPVVDALREQANFWLSDTICESFLKKAGEV